MSLPTEALFPFHESFKLKVQAKLALTSGASPKIEYIYAVARQDNEYVDDSILQEAWEASVALFQARPKVKQDKPVLPAYQKAWDAARKAQVWCVVVVWMCFSIFFYLTSMQMLIAFTCQPFFY